MVYIPNPTDSSQPTGNVDASTADDEFRALKAYVLGLALTAGMFAPVRQCANDGFVDATGNAAFLTAAAAGGEALDFRGATRPLVVNFAGGNTGTGVNDRNSTLTADAAGAISAIPPSNTSYIYADYVNAAAMTWGQTLAPVQYGKIYPRNIGAVLQFAGAAGSTVFLDDFGNTWAAVGGAKVQTNYFKFGTGGLGGAGATNALNGAADYLRCTDITSLGPNGWAMRCWVKPLNAFPGAGNSAVIMAMTNAAAAGATVHIFNNAGTIRFAYSLSSDGATNNIAANVQGTTLPVLGTEYFIELTFDALAGVYRLYVNGVQEQSTASANRICVGTAATIGATATPTSFFQGYVDKPEILLYCQHSAGTAYVTPAATPNIAAVGYAPDAFDIQAMKMYSVTGPSVAAAAAPATTQKYRVYLGEVDTGAVVPTTVRSYAFNGQFETVATAYVSGTNNVSHNLGVIPKRTQITLINRVSDAIAFTTDEMAITTAVISPVTAAGVTVMHRKNSSIFFLSNSAVIYITTTGVSVNATGGNYNVKMYISRGWGGA